MAEPLWKANVRVGQRIRRLRREAELSLRGLAAGAGCSVSVLSRIENGQANPSLSMLHAIVNALNSNIRELFDDTDTDNTKVMKADERPTMALHGESGPAVFLEQLLPHGSSERLQANIHVVEPNASTEGAISHDGEELGYVLEGGLELTVDGVSYQLNKGDSFFFLSDLPHGYRNVGSNTAKILWVNTPPTF